MSKDKQNKCCVCMKTPKILKALHETAGDTLQWCFKLSYCVPEIVSCVYKHNLFKRHLNLLQDWLEDYYLCMKCAKKVEQMCIFKQLCLDTNQQRQQNMEHSKSIKIEEIDYETNEIKIEMTTDVVQDEKLILPTSNKSRRLYCEMCNKRYKNRRALQSHRRRVHFKNQINCFCKLCQKVFGSERSFKNHNFNKHTDKSTFKHLCTICDRKFIDSYTYNVHTMRHVAKKPFACHLCNKRYVVKNELSNHIVSHSNGHPGKCYYCGEEYKWRRAMEVHLTEVHNVTIHRVSRVRNCLCNVCGKGFYSKTLLERHMPMHTGEKPFKCKVCEMVFSYKDSVVRHINKIHNNIVDN